MAVQRFSIGDKVNHRVDAEDVPPGEVVGFREEDGWVEVDWPVEGRLFHPDVNLWKV